MLIFVKVGDDQLTQTQKVSFISVFVAGGFNARSLGLQLPLWA